MPPMKWNGRAANWNSGSGEKALCCEINSTSEHTLVLWKREHIAAHDLARRRIVLMPELTSQAYRYSWSSLFPSRHLRSSNGSQRSVVSLLGSSFPYCQLVFPFADECLFRFNLKYYESRRY